MRIKFEKRDCWVGLHWNTESREGDFTVVRVTKFHLCLLPCLPITWTRTRTELLPASRCPSLMRCEFGVDEDTGWPLTKYFWVRPDGTTFERVECCAGVLTDTRFKPFL